MRANLFLFLLVWTGAASASSPHTPNVILYFHSSLDLTKVMTSAHNEAQRMLNAAGVSVVWKFGKPSFGGMAEVIEVELIEQRDPEFHPGALALATLGKESGTRIEIFYNRVVRTGGRENDVAPVLAHVLVHEITHILEGVSRHSETGVMKAQWGINDLRAMRSAPLPFAEEDLRLIHAWTERRSSTTPVR
jgi:hypothetical protein